VIDDAAVPVLIDAARRGLIRVVNPEGGCGDDDSADRDKGK
jgi:hypothetical protein